MLVPEAMMQYMWQHRMLPLGTLHTADGKPLRIIDPGRLNTQTGPDFFNAKLQIDSQMWAGDVELHVRASDWHRHGHHTNPAYGSVVLHVVQSADTTVCHTNGKPIPQFVMPCPEALFNKYSHLTDPATGPLPCRADIPSIHPIHLTDWLTALTMSRLDDKCGRIFQTLALKHGDWDETVYITLARALGFGTNADPMQRLANSVPLSIVRKHSDQIEAIEAILLGQSGLLYLPTPADDPYTLHLRQEHTFYAHKFGLATVQHLGFQTGRLRPGNSPHRRIALLAQLLCQPQRLTDLILSIKTVEQAHTLLGADPTPYWATHYSLGVAAKKKLGGLSRQSVESLMINALIPLMTAVARQRDDLAISDRALQLLQSLPAERNSITQRFTAAGIEAKDAFTTQAMIQLQHNYCEQRKCIYCRIGHQMLRKTIVPM